MGGCRESVTDTVASSMFKSTSGLMLALDPGIMHECFHATTNSLAPMPRYEYRTWHART